MINTVSRLDIQRLYKDVSAFRKYEHTGDRHPEAAVGGPPKFTLDVIRKILKEK